jgi:hypothetical protein
MLGVFYSFVVYKTASILNQDIKTPITKIFPATDGPSPIAVFSGAFLV